MSDLPMLSASKIGNLQPHFPKSGAPRAEFLEGALRIVETKLPRIDKGGPAKW